MLFVLISYERFSFFWMDHDDEILARCEDTLNRFKKWNEYVESEHKLCRSLYLKPIKITEPKGSPSKNGREKTSRKPDPLQCALECIDIELKYRYRVLPTVEENQERASKTISYYSNRRESDKPDPTIAPNKIHLRGKDETGRYQSPIHPHVSRGPPSARRVDAERNIKLRNKQISTARSSRKDACVPLPSDIRRRSFKAPPKATPFPSPAVLADFTEDERKTARAEEAFRVKINRANKSVERVRKLTGVTIPTLPEYWHDFSSR